MASHLITLKDWSGDDIRQVVQEGIALKQDPTRGRGALTHRTLALLFQKTSTRTRCSGEIGMSQLGGQAIYLDWRASNFGLADLGDELVALLIAPGGLAGQELEKHAAVDHASQRSGAARRCR